MKDKYSTLYFYKSLPKWKRMKDPFTTRIFYRPVSFFFASLCAKTGISANTVSYFSAVVAVFAFILFLPQNHLLHIVGAVLCNVWLVLDCVDGNLARCVKKQPFGTFADSMSSYMLVGTISLAMGYAVYYEGGSVIQPGNALIILLGGAASISDTMMRLIYQKYKSTERDLADQKVLEVEHDVRLDNNEVNNWRVRLESDFGIGGILPLLILLGTIFHALDLVIFYNLAYYGGSFLVITASLVRKAIRLSKKYQDNMPQ